MRVGGLDSSRGVEDHEAAEAVVDRDSNRGFRVTDSAQLERNGEGGPRAGLESPQGVHVDVPWVVRQI